MLAAAALLGFLSVAIGAYADHGLRGVLDADALRSMATAIRYNQIHAVAALAVALSAPSSVWLRIGGWGFIAGTALFSGGIYLSAIFGLKDLVVITPFGGVTLMAAWLALLVGGVLRAGASR